MNRVSIIYYLFFLLLFPSGVIGQTLIIRDASTGKAIEHVAVFNHDMTRSAISNRKGELDLGIFADSDSLFLQHPSYERMVAGMEEIRYSNMNLFLHRKMMMLDEIVLAVNRWEQERNEVPNQLSIIPRKEIQFADPQTAADLLTAGNAVFLQKSQLGGGSPMIRGFSANSVLLVTDGVRLNNAIYRSGNLQNVISLDPEVIEQSEVIYGPGSVVYGSDALGGVIDFHTLTPRLSSGDKAYFAANASSRFSSANKEKHGHLDMNLGFKKIGMLASISYSDFDDLRMGSRGNDSYLRPEYVDNIMGKDTVLSNPNPMLQKSSGYSQLNLMGKIRFMPGEFTNLTYAFHYSTTSDIPRYDRLIQYSDERLKYADWYYGPQKWSMHHFSGQFDRGNRIFDDSRLTMAYQNYQESRHSRKFDQEESSRRYEEVDIVSMNYDLHKSLGQQTDLYYGTEAVFNNVNSTANTGTSTRYPNGLNHYYSTALYSIFKHNFGEKYTLNTGIRYNYVYLRSTIEDNSTYNFPFDEIIIGNGALNGSFGLVYRPDEKNQLNLNLASGFRAPNLDDVAKVFDSEPGSVVVPNEELEPEYSYNLDLGWIREIGKEAELEISTFYTILENAMIRKEYQFNGQDSLMYEDEMSRVYAVVNAGRANIYGASLKMKSPIAGVFSVSADINLIKGSDNEGDPLRHVPPVYGGLHLLYKSPRVKADLYTLFNGELSADKLNPGERSKTHMYAMDDSGRPYSPAWYTVNFKSSIQATESLKLQLGVENILDQRYRPYSSGIVAPGRNFYISLRYNFS